MLLPALRLKLGRNMHRLRQQAGMSQETLSEKAEISARHLQKIESGEYGGSLAVLRRLRKALKCQWNDLLAGL